MESLLARIQVTFQGVDSTFSVLLALAIGAFLVGELVWIYLSSRNGVPGLPREDAPLKFIWSIAPAFLLALMLFVHSPRSPKKSAEVAVPSRSAVKAASVVLPAAPTVPRQGGV
jgi:hypothetical protein